MTTILSTKHIQTYQTLFPKAIFRLQTIRLDLLDCHPPDDSLIDTLSDHERQRFFSFKYPKRQLEWLGGRLAAKKAAKALLEAEGSPVPALSLLSVESTPTGRPSLRIARPKGREIDLSISHSGSMATALAVCSGTCGIDIQEISPVVIRVKSRFASAEEEAVLRTLPDLINLAEEARLSLLWSAKESFRKAYVCHPLLGFQETILTELKGSVASGLMGYFRCHRAGQPQTIRAFCTFYDSFAVAIAVCSV